MWKYHNNDFIFYVKKYYVYALSLSVLQCCANQMTISTKQIYYRAVNFPYTSFCPLTMTRGYSLNHFIENQVMALSLDAMALIQPQATLPAYKWLKWECINNFPFACPRHHFCACIKEICFNLAVHEFGNQSKTHAKFVYLFKTDLRGMLK